MMWVVLVGFLPSDHGRSCEAHPYGCGNALIEEEGDSVGRLTRLCLVGKTHLAGYEIKDEARRVVVFVLLLESTRLGILRVNLTVQF